LPAAGPCRSRRPAWTTPISTRRTWKAPCSTAPACWRPARQRLPGRCQAMARSLAWPTWRQQSMRIAAEGSDWTAAALRDVRLADARLGANLDLTRFTRVTAPRAQLPAGAPAALARPAGTAPPTPSAGHSALLSACAFSPDGQFVLTAAYDNSARLWDARRHRTPTLRRTHHRSPPAPSPRRAVRPHRRLGQLRPPVGRPLRHRTPPLRRAHRPLSACAFSPDGQFVLTAAWDNSARLWDARSGTELRRFDGHTGALRLRLLPDGQFVLTAADDNSARLWDARSGTELRASTDTPASSPPAPSPPTGSSSSPPPGTTPPACGTPTPAPNSAASTATPAALRLRLSPDGQFVLTAADDNSARLWDARSGTELRRFDGTPAALRLRLLPRRPLRPHRRRRQLRPPLGRPHRRRTPPQLPKR
jgi:hypothetical protein